jgi:AraC-like DNA-binding protein
LGVWLERQAVKAAADTPRPDAARRLVARYTALLEREFRSGAGVGDLAAELGVTPTHLTRCCKQSCGRSAHDIMADRRIFEARRLLAETDQPVGQIGSSLGFASAAYFTRAFQNMTGHSPSAFRRLQWALANRFVLRDARFAASATRTRRLPRHPGFRAGPAARLPNTGACVSQKLHLPAIPDVDARL